MYLEGFLRPEEDFAKDFAKGSGNSRWSSHGWSRAQSVATSPANHVLSLHRRASSILSATVFQITWNLLGGSVRFHGRLKQRGESTAEKKRWRLGGLVTEIVSLLPLESRVTQHTTANTVL